MKKTVLITGASSGIGKATSRLFADNGWNVVVTMCDPVKEMELAGPGAVTIGADRLRYLAGDDSRGFIRARREMSGQDYVDFVRSRFQSLEVAQ